MTFLLTSGCAGLGDYDISLPGGYSVVRTSAHQVTISRQVSEGVWGERVVPAKVVQIAWDERYILAKQVGLMNDPMRTNSSYQIPDESVVGYWIIDIQTDETRGPMTEEDFAARRKQDGISDSLILKTIQR
ncbi:DUF3997 domain-containing protein [Paenibacillus sp. RC67]|uniref:DUF3997 domain-containing protein n=1 Tax=Paenibacillus sp. RC67 TaxID=3039392 RepID=UPI0024ACCE6F|nr:DUF3997 domain-containing protein [Paenibacillus sp. RC67]